MANIKFCFSFDLKPSQHARAGPLRVKCGQCGLVRASQNRKGPVQVRCSFHEGKVQFSSGLIVNSRRVQEPCGSGTVW